MISYPFPPNASAGAVRSERFARYLEELGWKVNVITIKPRSDLSGYNNSQYFVPNMNIHATSTLDPWLWLREKSAKKLILRGIRSVLMRLFSFPDHMLLWLPFALKRALSIYRKEKFNAIYTTSPPHSTHLIGLILSKLTGIPLLADFRDPWTLNAYRGNSGFDKLLMKIEKIMEKAVYVNSSVILANTKANRKNMLKTFSFIKKNKVVYLPNGWEEFTENNIYDDKKNKQLTIVHAGTFYPKFKPYALFYALSAWRKGEYSKTILPLNKGDIQIILLGAKDETTKKLIMELGLEEFVIIKPWVAQAEARKYMCQADLLLASLGTGKESSTYVPSKLFEYMAAKRPVIGFFYEGESASLINETGIGVVFTKDEPDAIIMYLHEMIKAKENGLPVPYRPDDDKIKKYHIRSIVLKLRDNLESIINNSK